MPHYNVTAIIEQNGKRDNHVFLMPADNARSAARKALGSLMRDGLIGEVVIRAHNSTGALGALEVCERRATLKGPLA